jgi:hypothetical protein
VKSPVVGCSCRVVIRADWIAGTQSLPFKGTLQHLGKPAAHLDETSKCSLVTGRRGIADGERRRPARVTCRAVKPTMDSAMVDAGIG